MTIDNPCSRSQCSHLCVIIPHGYKCVCPVGEDNRECAAAREQSKPQPLICKCQNGGLCEEGAGTSEDGYQQAATQCRCPEGYTGPFCEHSKKKISKAGVSNAAVIVPVLLITLVILTSAALYIYYHRKSGESKLLSLSNSVSFREGSNVEFDGPNFNPQNFTSQKVTLDPGVDDSSRDFSNPMYDMKNTAQLPPVASMPPASPVISAGGDDGPATISPSAFSTHPSGPPPPVPPRHLNPVTFDSGKDTQCLVENDSDC